MYFRDILTVDPLREMDRIQREMNRLFSSAAGSPYTRHYPAVNMWSNADAVAISIELPGYNPEEVDVSIVGDSLVIKGRRQRPENLENEQYRRQERMFGEFHRTLDLPFKVDSEQIDARFQHGILNILLPRSAADRPRKIEIKNR